MKAEQAEALSSLLSFLSLISHLSPELPLMARINVARIEFNLSDMSQ